MNYKLERKASFYSSRNIQEIYYSNDNIDNGDTELEELRLAALKSLNDRKTMLNDLPFSNSNVNLRNCKLQYNHISTKSDRKNKFSTQDNQNLFCHLQKKSGLIEIVPDDANAILKDIKSKLKPNSSDPFCYLDCKNIGLLKDKTPNEIGFDKTCTVINSKTMENNQMKCDNKHEKKQEKYNYDDDDIILMSDHEEEDSLEQLMNEMEKEINHTQITDKKCDNDNNFHPLKRISSCTKYRTLLPQTTLCKTSHDKLKKPKFNQNYKSAIKSTSVLLKSKSSTKTIKTSCRNSELTLPKINNRKDFNSISTRTDSKSSLQKTSIVKHKHLTKNSNRLKSKIFIHSPINQISCNNSSTECVKELELKRSEKESISLNTVNTQICCDNYYKVCCKRLKCILKDCNYIKNNCTANSTMFKTNCRKYESMKIIGFEDGYIDTQTDSGLEEISDLFFTRLKEDKIKNKNKHDKQFSNEINNYPIILNCLKKNKTNTLFQIQERKVTKKKRTEAESYKKNKINNKICKRKSNSVSESEHGIYNTEDFSIYDRGDLRTELSRRRAEKLNKLVPKQSSRLLQSAFQEVENATRYYTGK